MTAEDERDAAAGLADTVAGLMPGLTADLARLVAIPSVSATNYPPETHAELLRARDVVVELLEGAGVQHSARSSSLTRRRS